MMKKKRKTGYVIAYLLTRLYDEYKQLMSDLRDPADIIAKLEDLKYSKLPLMKFDIKRQWINLTYEAIWGNNYKSKVFYGGKS